MSILYCLPNLSSTTTFIGEPWSLSYSVPKHPNALAYKKWATQPETKYCAYSGFEGLDPSMRVSATKNEPVRMHAFVADYDADLDDTEFKQFVANSLETDYPVSYVSRSYSGGIHAVWLFEEPILCTPPRSMTAFIKRLGRELKLKKLARGLDDDAAKHIGKYYLHGFAWRKVSEFRIPANLLNLWLYENTKGDDFNNYGVAIDLAVIEEEVHKRFPKRWTGPFKEGVRGPRFWADDGWNPTATVVRDTGMQAFAGEKPFLTWAEIFGRKFVQQHVADRLGSVIKSFCYDGKDFWQELQESGEMRQVSRQDFALYLKVAAGLNPRPLKGESVSELEQAMNMVVTQKRVAAVAPFVFHYDRYLTHDGRRVCNSATTKPISPDEEPKLTWGEGFAHTAKWLDSMFACQLEEGDEEQLPYFIGWLARAFQGAYYGRPNTGQALFLVGPPNCGKTLLSTQVIGPLFGGHAPASAFLQGKTDFNDHLFDVGVWTVDDDVPSKDQAVFTARIKEFTVNHRFAYNAKFRKTGSLMWKGRIVVTMNDDVRSIQMLPDMSMSVRDKVMVFQVGTEPVVLTREVIDSLSSELPAFARYLLDYTIPEESRDLRFGIRAYSHRQIRQQAMVDGRFSSVLELVSIFREQYFGEDEDTPYWEGSASALMQHLSQLQGVNVLLKDVNTRKLGWGLKHLRDTGCEWLDSRDVGNMLKWQIRNPLHDEG